MVVEETKLAELLPVNLTAVEYNLRQLKRHDFV